MEHYIETAYDDDDVGIVKKSEIVEKIDWIAGYIHRNRKDEWDMVIFF